MVWTHLWYVILMDFGDLQEINYFQESKIQMQPNPRMTKVVNDIHYFWAPVVFYLFLFLFLCLANWKG